MPDVPHTAAVTPAEVAGVALDSLPGAGDELATSDALASICMGVTGRIEAYLSRPLIVQQKRQRLEHWSYRESHGQYLALTQAWPVVQIDNGGYAVGPSDDEILSGRNVPVTLDTYAGYRRQDQNLKTLQEDLPELTELPPVLPYDIREVAIVLTLFRLSKRMAGNYGMARQMENVAQSMVTVQTTEPDFEGRVLDQIHTHRRLI